MDILTEVIKWAIPAVLGGALGWALSIIKDMKRKADQERADDNEKLDALCEGVRSLLRTELIRTHDKHVKNGVEMTLTDREYLERTYDAYHRLGGNGTGTELYNATIAKFHGKAVTNERN